ncbi:MAG: hypothetical protein Ta2A_14150 [Treponemataceae bacterium]|nr:MAG: hypothetical protein Ta2A_14150 [Treponemataceae bacterium]
MYSQDYYGDEYYDDYYTDDYYSDEYYDDYSEGYYGDGYSATDYTTESTPEPTATSAPVADTASDAEEFSRTLSFGLGLELNGLFEHLDGFHAGGFFHSDFRFTKLMALGLKASYVHDFLNTVTLNSNVRNFFGVGLLARFYFAEVDTCEFFAQVEGGLTIGRLSGIVSYEKFGKTELGFWAGAEVGARININKVLYVEPFIRAGYPFVWATGVAIGFALEPKKPIINIIRYPRAVRTPKDKTPPPTDSATPVAPETTAPTESDSVEYYDTYYGDDNYSDEYSEDYGSEDYGDYSADEYYDEY